MQTPKIRRKNTSQSKNSSSTLLKELLFFFSSKTPPIRPRYNIYAKLIVDKWKNHQKLGSSESQAYLVEAIFKGFFKENIKESNTYYDAIRLIDSKKWQKAIEEEYNSLIENNT